MRRVTSVRGRCGEWQYKGERPTLAIMSPNPIEYAPKVSYQPTFQSLPSTLTSAIKLPTSVRRAAVLARFPHEPTSA